MAQSGYTTRKAAFKQLDSAIGNLDTLMQHLLNVASVYEPEHPGIADHCKGLANAALILQQSIENLRKSF